MSSFFTEYARIVVFFHVLLAVIWIGGMIAIRFSVHKALLEFSDNSLRISTSLKILGKFFQFVISSIVIIGATGIFMMKSIDYTGLLAGVIHLKTQLWTLMTMVFGYIYFRFIKAQNAFESGNTQEAAKFLAPIAKYLIPVNIALGMLAILFGVILRGF